MTARQGFWLSTYTGKRVYPLDLQAVDFCIEDIAHGLANVCRYAGQAAAFYSVAEHCVRGSKHASSPFIALEFLLHDAAEAYVGDAVRAVVEILDDYRELRDKMQAAINRKFNLGWPPSAECEAIDDRMLRTEAPMMFLHEDKWWAQPRFGEPFVHEWIKQRGPRFGDDTGSSDKALATPLDVQFWPPRMAERLFLARFKQLTSEVEELIT